MPKTIPSVNQLKKLIHVAMEGLDGSPAPRTRSPEHPIWSLRRTDARLALAERIPDNAASIAHRAARPTESR